MTTHVVRRPHGYCIPRAWTVWTFAGRTFERRNGRVFGVTAAEMAKRKVRLRHG